MSTRTNVEPQAFHPLMDAVQQPISRRAALLGACGLVAARMSASAQEASGTPDIRVSGDDEAVSLLERSAQVLADLESFSFEMETIRGSSTIMQGFELNSVSGVIRRPTDMQAEVEVSIPLGDLRVGAVSVDGVFYIQDPLSDGSWMELGEMGELQALINPDVLILRAVQLVQDAEVVGTGKVDGADTVLVEGLVDFSGLLEGLGEEAAEIRQFLADEPVIATFWIDDEDRILEVELLGPILASESDDVVRRVTLSNFNEPVDIEVPDVVATPAG